MRRLYSTVNRRVAQEKLVMEQVFRDLVILDSWFHRHWISSNDSMTCPSSTRKSRHRHGLIISYGSNDKFTHRKPSAKSHDTRRCITTHFHHQNQIEKRNRIAMAPDRAKVSSRTKEIPGPQAPCLSEVGSCAPITQRGDPNNKPQKSSKSQTSKVYYCTLK